MAHREHAPRLFTLAEAEALLPDLETVLGELNAQASILQELQTDIARLRQVIHSNGNAGHLEDLTRRAREFEQSIRENLDQIATWGIELKDVQRGLVDFPYQRGGRVVYLCWQLGERGIGWWHEIAAGFAGRQPIATL